MTKLANGQPEDHLPTAPDSCPIAELLGRRVTQMTDEELEVHVTKMRAARESPQIMRSLLAGKTKKVSAGKVKVKPNLSLLD